MKINDIRKTNYFYRIGLICTSCCAILLLYIWQIMIVNLLQSEKNGYIAKLMLEEDPWIIILGRNK